MVAHDASAPLRALDLFPYRLPLVQPLVLKGGTHTHRRGVLVRVTTAQGATGWGDAPPLPGFSPFSYEDVLQQLQRVPLSLAEKPTAPAARFALEAACWEAATGGDLLHNLGPFRHPALSLNGLLTTDLPLAEAAERLRAAGFPAVKLKVGQRPLADDIARTRALAEAVGPTVKLRLDANRAWSLEEARTFAAAVADLALDYLEEPLADPAHLPTLAAHGLPVALDESLTDGTVATLADHAYARAILLKPTLLGFHRTRQLAQEALDWGITPVFSAAFESGVGLRWLVALAASFSPPGTPAGLDTYRWLAEDVLVERLPLGQAQVDVAAVLGAPFSLNPGVLTEAGG